MTHVGLSQRRLKALSDFRNEICKDSGHARQAFNNLVRDGCDRDELTGRLILVVRTAAVGALGTTKAFDPWKKFVGLPRKEVLALPWQLEETALRIERINNAFVLSPLGRIGIPTSGTDSEPRHDESLSEVQDEVLRSLPLTLRVYSAWLKGIAPKYGPRMLVSRALARLIDEELLRLIGWVTKETKAASPPFADLSAVLLAAPIPTKLVVRDDPKLSDVAVSVSRNQFSRKALEKLVARWKASTGNPI